MLNNKVIQKVIDDLKNITKIELCISDINGNINASTFNSTDISKSHIADFSKSMAEIQVIDGYNFFKVAENSQVYYIVIVKGGRSEDCYTIGKICVSHINILINAYKDKYDQNSFIQNLILDNMLLVDIYNRAKKLGIENNIKRVVIMIKSQCEKDMSSLEMIKNIFEEDDQKNFITVVDEKNIIILKSLKEDERYEDIVNICNVLLDMFNTEIMVKAKISYGTIINDLKNVSKSYKEAKMSMDIRDIFYTEKNIIGYDCLGVGRLIYQLPNSLCKIFIREIFKDQMPDSFDKETITTIHKFFENSLNISETARNLYIHRNTLVYRLEKLQKTTGLDIKNFDDALVFKLALMVVNYMKYIENRNN